MKRIIPYAVSILISLGTGLLSALITSGSMDIYSRVETPPLSPPPILFPIVWTVLYILMGISAAMIYTSAADGKKKKAALTVYGISLFFNFGWSLFFFSLQAFLFSFIWLLILLILIIKTVFDYYSVNKTAALLQIPYILWVTFAGYLNLGIWLLNK